jgi:hypothetical protein
LTLGSISCLVNVRANKSFDEIEYNLLLCCPLLGCDIVDGLIECQWAAAADSDWVFHFPSPPMLIRCQLN